MTAGTLFVVATPIGNLEDLSPRAVAVLKAVALVAAEDTRHTGRLLRHAGVNARQLALHDHNEEAASERIIEALRAGRDVALVSDAGTPLVSDPGFKLLRLAHAAGIVVCPVPGPSALTAALSVAGLPTDRFCFEGFLPAREKARRERLVALAREPRTLLFYESVHRVCDTVADLAELFGADRPAFVGRELSKRHEQCVAAPLGELAGLLGSGGIPLKGEFVLATAGAAAAAETGLDVDELLKRLQPLMPARQAIDIATAVSGRGRNEVYRRMLEIAGKDEG